MVVLLTIDRTRGGKEFLAEIMHFEFMALNFGDLPVAGAWVWTVKPTLLNPVIEEIERNPVSEKDRRGGFTHHQRVELERRKARDH